MRTLSARETMGTQLYLLRFFLYGLTGFSVLSPRVTSDFEWLMRVVVRKSTGVS